MFPFRSKKPDLPPFMTPEFKQYLELHGLLVDIKLGQSLMQLRLDRMSEQIADLQRPETPANPRSIRLFSLQLGACLEDDDFEADERRYAAQDVQEFMNLPEVQRGIAQARADFEAFKAHQSITNRTSRPPSVDYPWKHDSSLKEARRLLQLQHPEYTSPAIGSDPLELLKKDWMTDAQANRPESEGACS